jgi:hypothetical protein
MADNERNKFNAGATWGDADPIGLHAEQDNLQDRNADGAGIPNVNVNNKFPVNMSFGDSDPNGITTEADNKADVASDGGGVPNVNQGEQTNMQWYFEPNKFPRETGHDTAEDPMFT